MTTSRDTHPALAGRRAAFVGRRLALVALAVLTVGAVVFTGTWAIFGQEAVTDNWVGFSVLMALWFGLLSALMAMVLAVVAGMRGQAWSHVVLPLATFPAVVVVIALLETFVFE